MGLVLLTVLASGCRYTVADPDHPSDSSNRQNSKFPSQFFSPYFDVSLNERPSLTETSAASGVKYFTLAFITNDRSANCRASWGGVKSIESDDILADIKHLRASNGDVIVSFGGQKSDELATVCSDVDTLRSQYESVIKKFEATSIDFDIEGSTISDSVVNDRRSTVIATLQQDAIRRGYQLKVSFTLPVTPQGLTRDGIACLQNAIDKKVNISIINVLAMNYGESAPPDKMGENAISAANNAIHQISKLFPEKSLANVNSMFGITPMIGVNDVSPEKFSLDDARMLSQYVKENGIARVSMWSMSRDKECHQNGTVPSPVCSGVPQRQFDYSQIFKQSAQPGN